MGRGYVTIDKIQENQLFVWYKFETPVYESGIVDYSKGSYFLEPGVFMAKGLCKINKKTGEFILDGDNTDPYFFKDTFWVGAVQVKLLKFFRAGLEFPDATCWAS